MFRIFSIGFSALLIGASLSYQAKKQANDSQLKSYLYPTLAAERATISIAIENDKKEAIALYAEWNAKYAFIVDSVKSVDKFMKTNDSCLQVLQNKIGNLFYEGDSPHFDGSLLPEDIARFKILQDDLKKYISHFKKSQIIDRNDLDKQLKPCDELNQKIAEAAENMAKLSRKEQYLLLELQRLQVTQMHYFLLKMNHDFINRVGEEGICRGFKTVLHAENQYVEAGDDFKGCFRVLNYLDSPFPFKCRINEKYFPYQADGFARFSLRLNKDERYGGGYIEVKNKQDLYGETNDDEWPDVRYYYEVLEEKETK